MHRVLSPAQPQCPTPAHPHPRPPPRLQGNASVLPGLEDVLVGLRPGSKIRALVPPELGYQAQPGSQPQVGGEGGREGCWLR